MSRLTRGALELLHQKRPEAASAEGLGNLHVNIAVGAVVMEEDAAGGGDGRPLKFEQIRGASVELL